MAKGCEGAPWAGAIGTMRDPGGRVPSLPSLPTNVRTRPNVGSLISLAFPASRVGRFAHSIG